VDIQPIWGGFCPLERRRLLTMYVTPDAIFLQSPGIVIIEVDWDFDQFEALLGLHSWSKFLLRPLGEEQDKGSKVFWCHYNSGRSVQKHVGPVSLYQYVVVGTDHELER
jgi:hypothetical protein